MPIHIDAAAAEDDAFHFKPEPLLKRILARHADGAARAHHAVPR